MTCSARSILLLDDNADHASLFIQILQNQQFQVRGFTKPLLALEHFQKNSDRYDLVICDIRMPRINGYEFVRKIKEIKPEIKVVLTTAYDIDEIEFSSVKDKVDELIEKPIIGSVLGTMIRKHIS